jgi:hypothetical protein
MLQIYTAVIGHYAFSVLDFSSYPLKYIYILLFKFHLFHLSVLLTQVLGCGLDCRGYESGYWQEIFFLLLQNIQTSSVACPASYVMGTGVRSQAIKQQEHKVDRLATSSVEFKNDGAVPLLLLYNL